MTGAIKPPLRSIAFAAILLAARITCADRLRVRGHDVEAQCFERGERDESWAMVHEINKLRAETAQSSACCPPCHQPVFDRLKSSRFNHQEE